MAVEHILKSRSGLFLVILLTWIPVSADAQSSRRSLEGMWSDPPYTAVGSFCAFACTDAGIDRLNGLLDDPANDARPFEQLQADTKAYEREYLRARLTDAALKTYPLDPADDPGFLRCEPWGLARQMFAPHQIEIWQRGNDRIELRYGEWDARRTVYLNGGKRPPTVVPSTMGYSVGRWDGETLVVETSGIAANIANWADSNGSARHSDQLRVIERYTRSKDGKTLLLTATMEDPWSLRVPVVMKKIWGWAPDQKITAYKDCQRPTEFKRGVKR